MSVKKVSRPKNVGQSIDDVAIGGARDRVRPSDLVDIYKVPEKWTRLRLFGPVFAYGGHWVTFKNKEGKKSMFYTPCSAFDQSTGRLDATLSCAWCQHKGAEEGAVRFSVDYYTNCIVRSLQKQKPSEAVEPTEEEAQSGFKDKDSETWTPVRALRLSTGPLRLLKDLKSLNVHENKDGDSEGYPVSHLRYGCDVNIKQNESAAPAQRYQVQKGEHTPLTKLERQYLTYDLSELQQQPSPEETELEYEKWFERNHKKKVEDEDEDDLPPKKRKKPVVEDDEDEDDLPPKKRKKPIVEGDDDDDEDDLPPKKRKKPVVEDDDDEDDLPPKKRKKPIVEDDDDEDDLPPKKRIS